MARTATAQMTRMTFRLWPDTLKQLKDIESKQPRSLKRHPSERVRLVIEDYVERQARRQTVASK